MSRQRLDLADRDLVALARVLGTDPDELRDELARRPWYANDVLRNPAIADAVLKGADDLGPGDISPALFFAVVAHCAAAELANASWVADWMGPAERLPVFDVEPLLEFTDAPGRLMFVSSLLTDFVAPELGPVPGGSQDLDELVDWLGAVEPADRIALLRHLGDLALFKAGIFPDSTGAEPMGPAQAAHLGRSVGMSDEEIEELSDPCSPTPGLDALERLGSAWYRAAAEASPATPTVLRDIAARIRPARRFLNHLADTYLHPVQPGSAFS